MVEIMRMLVIVLAVAAELWLYLLWLAVQVLEVKTVQVGALVKIQAEARVAVTSLTQVGSMLMMIAVMTCGETSTGGTAADDD
jgi:hypothetical protein